LSGGAGSRLGPYEITANLGEGGMGEVYRATDSKLKREVAIKVLPAAFTQDKERLARFEREAQLLAQLNHPNIAHIYGMEASGDSHALVMELVEGPTLADRLAQGALPLDEALSIAKQIAEALEEAHEKGIVHRDLKPQNVKASIEGRAKVLDFGLAKAMEPAGSASSSPPSAADVARSPTLMNSPTLTAAHGTQLGVILGTAAYMAPEQARGGAVDKRADIWAFGVLLWEMLSGRRLFEGETVSDTLAGVLRAEIDLGSLPPATPPAIRHLLRRCLERNPKNRLHDIADARIALDEVLRGAGEEPGIAPASGVAAARRPGWVLPVALGAAAAIGFAAAWLLRGGGAARPPDLELALAIPAGYTIALDNHPGVTLSADGRRQVVTLLDDQGRTHLLVRDLARAEARILPGTENATAPVLAPDGEAVAFLLESGLQRMSLAGGPPMLLATTASEFRGATWSPDGYLYISSGTSAPLVRVPENGGPIQPVTELDPARRERTHRWPEALPDGSAVLFTSDTVESSEYYDDARIEAVRPATGERTVVLEGSSQARFLAPDHLLFARAGTIFAVRFDARQLKTAGTPVPLLQSVSTEVSSGAVRFATASSGAALWIPGELGKLRRQFVWVEPGGAATPVDLPVDRYLQLALAPDERRLVASIDAGASQDLWAVDLEQKRKSRLTFAGSPTDFVWSPDGSRVAYGVSTAESGLDMFWKLADGSAEAELLQHIDGEEFPSSFTPDGRALLFETQPPGRNSSDVARLDLASGRVEPVLSEPYAETFPVVSPDGRWLAYTSAESMDRTQIIVRRYPELTGKWQISLDGGIEPKWAPEGDALYFRAAGFLHRVSIDTRSGFVAGVPERVADGIARGPLGYTYAVARGGRVLVARDLDQVATPQQVNLALDLASRARRLTTPRR